MYGKDGKNNRILYSPKLSQGSKLVVAKPTRQAAGVSGGGTKVRVTGRGRLMATVHLAG